MKVVFTCYIYDFHMDFCHNIAEEVEKRGGEVIYATKDGQYDNVDFTVRPDESYPSFGGKAIWTNHGMPVIPQHPFYYSERFRHRLISHADYIFTYSKAWVEWHQMYGLPVIVVGYPRLDKIFNTNKPDGTVVYAPTHHHKPGVYSGDKFNVESIRDYCFELGYKDFIYRKHPAFTKNQLSLEECYRRASVFISDYSTVGLESAILNIPTILIGDIEWLNIKNDHISSKVDKAAIRVYEFDDLKKALRTYKENPNYLEDKRLEWSSKACEYQGVAAKRMVDVMEELL